MKKGFTLIELLIVLAIIGILVTISSFALQEARRSARDARRKSDLEQIRSAIALYRSDCGEYPLSLTFSSPLVGDDSSLSCSSSNVYISEVPNDPQEPDRNYFYVRITSATYAVCTALERPPGPSPAPVPSDCGSCGKSCNYKVTNL